MTDYKKLIDTMMHVDETFKHIQEQIARCTDSSYSPSSSLTCNLASIKNAIEKYATADFEVGCHVVMVKDYTFEKFFENGQLHGWWCNRHTFKQGAGATVREISIGDDGEIVLNVDFDKLMYELDYPPERKGEIVDYNEHYHVEKDRRDVFGFRKQWFTQG